MPGKQNKSIRSYENNVGIVGLWLHVRVGSPDESIGSLESQTLRRAGKIKRIQSAPPARDLHSLGKAGRPFGVPSLHVLIEGFSYAINVEPLAYEGKACLSREDKKSQGVEGSVSASTRSHHLARNLYKNTAST